MSEEKGKEVMDKKEEKETTKIKGEESAMKDEEPEDLDH